MKRLIIAAINKYQQATNHTAPTCRYTPTCSTYAKTAFQRHNVFKAAVLSMWRILRCNPFSKGGVDPVPLNKAQKQHNDHTQHGEGE